jgi:RNA polymerase sigma factor (sigma-70 family)
MGGGVEPTSTTSSDPRSDADLIVAARAGDAGAFGMLYERHAGAALVVARQYTRGTAEAEDVVSDAFAAVWSAFRGGSGPTDAFRAYLYTVVRRVAAVQRDKGRRAEPTDDVAVLEAGSMAEPAAEEPALAGFERSAVARAFASLPERWQAVLWHSEIEGLTPAQIAPLLGLSANSTAALAYRAREGLRQAYLQQHLADPLDEACRAVAGKLGGYVRGGLGARDTVQVEAHLDECGNCRALVLELRDVNRGLRGVIAPLVLGIAGLGALKFTLPTSGGTAAGAASLSAGGAGTGAAGGAAAGAGTGAGVAGSGAAGATGAGAAGAVSAVGAVGAAGAGVGGALGAAGASAGAAAGAAASGGFFAAIGGALAAIPTAVAAGIAGVIVVAGATLGIVQLTGGHDEPPATGATSTAQPSGTPSGAPSASAPAATPFGLPTEPSSPPTAEPGPAADDDTDDSSVVAAAGDHGAAAAATPSPSAGPVATPPASEGTTLPAGAPHLVVTPGGGLVLAAGEADQPLTVQVANTGDAPATDLTADVGLPDGVSPRGLVASTSGRYALHVAAATWSCSLGDDGTVHCTLPVLDAGEVTTLTVTVDVAEDFAGDSGDVSWRIHCTGVDYQSPPTTVKVSPAPARVDFVSVPGNRSLLRGRPSDVDLAVRNYGGRAAPATVTVDVPDGVTVTAGAAGWTCGPVEDSEVTCTLASLAPRTTSTLVLRVTAGADAPDGGALLFAAAPAGKGAAPARVGFTVTAPAHLVVTADLTELPLAYGSTATTTVTIANTGGVAATGVAAHLTLPAGTSWAGAGTGDWRCAADETSGGVDCSLAWLAAGATSDLPVALDVVTAADMVPGPLVVRLSASSDADLVDPLTVATRVVPPVLTLAADDPVLTLGTTSGTVAAHVAVSGAAASVAVGVQLPVGLTFDQQGVRTPADCTFDTARSATCDAGPVAAGGAVDVLLPVVVGDVANTGTVTITASATGAASVSASAVARTSSANLSLRYQGTGTLRVTEVGAPVLGCPASGCGAAANNNDLAMTALDEAAPAGARVTSVPVSSSATLTLPAGATVRFAGLYWSANRAPADAWSTGLDTASLRGPGGGYATVSAAATSTVTDNAKRTYYQSFADVTDVVAARPAGTWSVADVAVSAGRSDTDRTYYAGWALVVVYDDPTPGTDQATVTVYDGAAWVGTSTPAPRFRFVAQPGGTARVGVVAWEGDLGTTGDQLVLDGSPLTPTRPDGRGSPNNAFDSTAAGWRTANSYGVDAKGFAPGATAADVATLTATTTGDQYLLGAVTVRAPAE